MIYATSGDGSGPAAWWTGDNDARADQVRRERPRDSRQRRLDGLQQPEQDSSEPFVHSEMVRQAAAEVLSKDEAAAWLAPRDRLPLPRLHARGAAVDSRRQAGRRRSAA